MNKYRWIGIAILALVALLAFRLLPLEQFQGRVRERIESFGVWGPVALVALYVVATVLLVPGTFLTLVAGATYGLWVGTAIVSIGSTTGAAMAFLIARYFARDHVARLAHRRTRFGAIDRAIGEGGWKVVALLRLSPVVPFNLQNYLYGVTPIRFGSCILASWIAMLPGTFLYVYIGHVTGTVIRPDRQRSPWEWALLAAGLVATLLVTVYVTRLANRHLQAEVVNGGAKDELNA